MTVTRYPFTRARLDAEQVPEKGRREVWDTDAPALCCRITAKGDRALWVCKWAEGATRWIKVGDHPTMTVKDARARALELINGIAKGARPWETRAALKAEATLADLWDHYRQHHAAAHKRASSIASDESIWRTTLESWGGRKQLRALTRGEVQRLITKKGKAAPIRANRTLALLSSMFNRAKAGGLWAGENPCEGVQRFKELSRDRFLKPDELRALFASLMHEDEAWALYFRASILCGARRGNMLGMRWADIDLSRGLWRVPGEESKNGEPMLVILSVDLVRALTDWRTRCGSPMWVFPSPESKTGHKVEPQVAWKRTLMRGEAFRLVALMAKAEGWTPEREQTEREGVIVEVGRQRLLALGRRASSKVDPLAAALDQVRAKAKGMGLDDGSTGLLDVRLHDCRRTLGSWAAMTGSTSTVIGRALGHRSIQTTAIYTRMDLDPVRAAVETAGAAILHAAGEFNP